MNEPVLSDSRICRHEVLAGSRDSKTRLAEIWQDVLEEFEAPPIDPAINEAFERYVTKSKESLGNDEPMFELHAR